MPTIDASASTLDSCLPLLLARQRQRAPEAIAIAAPGRTPLSYRLLHDHVSKVVAILNSMGIGRNDRVALVLPNGPEMAVACVALAAAATSAPLNPDYRASEFDFYLSDLRAKALLIQAGMDSPARAQARARRIPIIELSPVSEGAAGLFTLNGAEFSDPTCSGFARPDDVAFALHSSGTTSRPKLIPLTHTNVCVSAHNARVAFNLGETDRCLNVMPLFHIHGLVSALLAPLAAGGSVVCTPGLDGLMFFEWLQTFSPTWYTAVPSMHQAILANVPGNQERIASCPLRFIRSASVALPLQVTRELEGAFHVPVIECYGMTEASGHIASNPLPPRQRKPGSAGLAAGPEVAIMSDAGTLLRLCEKGEIVIRGANVMQGYENNPAANRSAFTDGWFRTGDEGCLDSDGYLFITGRRNEIINRGGEKVSPREIDEVLTNHPDVREAAAFPVRHSLLGEDIAAAVVPRDNASITEPMIREYLFGRLADFKIPSQVLIVDEIPKTATGKIQRFHLAEKFGEKLKAEFVAPNSELERKVAGIYAEVLSIHQVGRNDNFFALGGDSLTATLALSRISSAFHVELPMSTLFRKPTVAELAGEISDQTLATEVLAEVDTLSDELAERLVAAELDSPTLK